MSNNRVRSMITTIMSLEDGDSPAVAINVNVHNPDEAAMAAASSDAMDAQADVANAKDNVDETEAASEEVQDTAANLESIAVALEAAIKDGGLNSQALVFANVAINNELRRLGIDDCKLSMESVGTARGRLEQTRISLETVGGALSRAWDAIKRFFISLWRKITEFFAKFFGYGARLGRYAESLKKLSNEISDDRPPKSDDPIKVSDARWAMNMDLKVYDAKSNFCGGIEVMTEGGTSMLDSFENTPKLLEEALNYIKNMEKDNNNAAKNIPSNEDIVKDTFDPCIAELKTMAKKVSLDIFKALDLKLMGFPLWGESVISQSIALSKTIDKMLPGNNFNTERFKVDDKSLELKIPTAKIIKETIETAIKQADLIKKYKSRIYAVENKCSKIFSDITKMVDRLFKSGFTASRVIMHLAMRVITLISAIMITFHSAMFTETMAVLKFIGTAISKYPKK